MTLMVHMSRAPSIQSNLVSIVKSFKWIFQGAPFKRVLSIKQGGMCHLFPLPVPVVVLCDPLKFFCCFKFNIILDLERIVIVAMVSNVYYYYVVSLFKHHDIRF